MLGTLVGTVWLYIVIPKGFFPTEDTGFINGATEGPSNISFNAMTARTRQVADILRKDPAVDYLNLRRAPEGRTRPTISDAHFVALKPRSEREDTRQR